MAFSAPLPSGSRDECSLANWPSGSAHHNTFCPCCWLCVLYCEHICSVVRPPGRVLEMLLRRTGIFFGRLFPRFLCKPPSSLPRLSQCRSIDARATEDQRTAPLPPALDRGSRRYFQRRISRSEQRQHPTVSERHLGCSAWTPFWLLLPLWGNRAVRVEDDDDGLSYHPSSLLITFWTLLLAA